MNKAVYLKYNFIIVRKGFAFTGKTSSFCPHSSANAIKFISKQHRLTICKIIQVRSL